MAHELVHGVAQVGGSVAHGVRAPAPPHGREVVGRQKHLEQTLEGLALHECVQAPVVQAECAENVRQGSENLPSGRNVFDEQGVQDHVCEPLVLEAGEEGGLLEHVGRHHVGGEKE